MGQRRWGTLMAEHRPLVITTWIVLLIACGVSFPFLFKQLKAPNYGVEGAQSTRPRSWSSGTSPGTATSRT